MTGKLFYEDTKQTAFTAEVLACSFDDTKKLYRIELNRTAFFPEEGGQNADRGTLQGLDVKDVKITRDTIFHYTEKELLPGTTVTGQVDWARRFDTMQQHTGEHILSGLIFRQYGYANVGFHLGDVEVTLDFNGTLTWEQLKDVEREANEAVWKNIPIIADFPSKEVLSGLSYRSKIEIEGAVRIVEIPGYDTCACCAPHVDTTGQIGLIKITGVQSHRGGIRVNILCGGRALSDYSVKQDSISSISVLLSARHDMVADAVVRLKEESAGKQERINSLQAALLQQQIAALPSPDEVRHVMLFSPGLDSIAMRGAVNSLCETYSGYCGIFAGNDSEGYHYIIGSAGEDCSAAAALLREKLQAKGGGSQRMIQGSLTAGREEIEVLFRSSPYQLPF